MKLLEENIEEKLPDIGFGIHFSSRTPKAPAAIEKTDTLGLHQN